MRQLGWIGSCFALIVLLGSTASVHAQNEMLNIWLVAHSHDDTGWLRTVDEYYIYEVQYILDSVVDSLILNPNRKFVEVEMAFFSRWWREQTESRKTVVRQLVRNRQLVFVNGGWCMNDDAVPIYYAMIDQMTLGHEFISKEFGESAAPTVGWHIDPFGHSNVIAPLYNKTGFDAWYINRIDYRLKDELKGAKQLEFIWHGSRTLGSTAPMWIHMMDNHYCTPNGFNWEHGVTQDLPSGDGPPPVVVDPPSAATENNELARATDFVNMARERAAVYKTNNILIPFGCDFTFQNANMMFKNMDRLIDAVNKYSTTLQATARYTDLDDYADFVKTESDWTVTQDDFYPYADNGMSYWTGYFTSRQNVKTTSRIAHSLLRNAEFVHAFTRSLYSLDRRSQLEDLFTLKAPEAVLQHHDGVTGTFRELVGLDYLKLLHGGMNITGKVFADNLGRMVSGGQSNQLTEDPNALDAGLLEGRTVPVVVYNSLPHTRHQYVSFVVSRPDIEVTRFDGSQSLPFQVDARSDGKYNVFVLVTVPAMGYTSFNVELFTGKSGKLAPIIYKAKEMTGPVENEYLRIEFNNNTNLIDSIVNKRTGAVVNTDAQMYLYRSWTGLQPSGAYIFRPVGAATPFYPTTTIEVIDGPLVKSVIQVFKPNVSVQTMRLFTGLDQLNGAFIDVDHVIGPLEYDEEVSLRFTSDIQNSNLFYTDNNGLEFQPRTSNIAGRPGDADEGVRIAGNFYPAVARTFIRDASDRQLTIVSQTTHAASSLANGQLELLLHRRCSRDDARGMNEPLNDRDVVTAKLRILFDTAAQSARLHHRHLLELNLATGLVFGQEGADFPLRFPEFSPLKNDFPENLQLVSFNPRDVSDQVIIRLLNPFEKDEHPTLSQPVSVDLTALFEGFGLSSIEERTLTLLHSLGAPSQPVVVNPMDIKTFVAVLSQQQK